MKNLKEREDIIKFALMLNTTNLSPLRSGNLSIRVIENDVEGFLLTPSGIKYETLKPEDIVFLALDEKYDNLSTSEQKFNSSKGGNLEINPPSFGGKMSFCDVTTPAGQHLNFSKPRIGNEIQRYSSNLS